MANYLGAFLLIVLTPSVLTVRTHLGNERDRGGSRRNTLELGNEEIRRSFRSHPDARFKNTKRGEVGKTIDGKEINTDSKEFVGNLDNYPPGIFFFNTSEDIQDSQSGKKRVHKKRNNNDEHETVNRYDDVHDFNNMRDDHDIPEFLNVNDGEHYFNTTGDDQHHDDNNEHELMNRDDDGHYFNVRNDQQHDDNYEHELMNTDEHGHNDHNDHHHGNFDEHESRKRKIPHFDVKITSKKRSGPH